jgi:stress response protein YsnF
VPTRLQEIHVERSRQEAMLQTLRSTTRRSGFPVPEEEPGVQKRAVAKEEYASARTSPRDTEVVEEGLKRRRSM